MAAGDLTTLANVKVWFSPPLTTTSDDALLTRLITAASQFIQIWLGRQIASQSYAETRDGAGGRKLVFANAPATAVASLSIDGIAIPPASGPSTAGYVFSATTLYLQSYLFSPGFQNVAVAYTAGYGVTPPELEQACIELVALRYKERDRIGQVSKNLSGEVVSFTQKDMPADVQTVLQQYKRSFVP
ncbi:MAG TPA: hypothetical protein VF930_09865 [Stellaceae bacterium]